MRIAWPEIVIGFLLLLELLFLGVLALTSGHAGEAAWFTGLLSLLWFPIVTLLPFWLILRFIDLVFAGPARRKGYLIVRFLP